MLIILEGLPGSGKTTLAKRLSRKLKGVLIPQIILRFPRNYKNFSISKKERFFMKNDLEKYKKASKALKNKQWVIMDRGIFSTLAYNYALTRLKKGNTYESVLNWYKKYEKNFTAPQIIFLLKVSLKTSLRRKNRLLSKTFVRNLLWTNINFLKELEIFYQNLLPKLGKRNIKIIRINANQSLKKVLQNILKKIRNIEIYK